MHEFFQNLIIEGKNYSVLEVIAVITAIIYVLLASKGNRWCFLFGLISSSIYVYITFKLKFYFDVTINFYYVIMSFWGWFAWTSNTSTATLPVHKIKRKRLLYLILIGLSISFISAFSLDRFSDPSLPYFDAFTTIFAIIATWLVIKRVIENWLIWIVVDAVASFMYFYKELYLTALLFIIYTLIAIFGYQKWKKLPLKN